jgi:SseB protein N-terminal domain
MDKASLRALIDSTVHVLGSMNENGGNMMIQNGKASYGTSATPFFSSVEVLQQSVDASQSYLSMSTRMLFELLPDTHLVLNPRSAGRYDFSPDLTRQLRDGSYFLEQEQEQSLGARVRSILSFRKK